MSNHDDCNHNHERPSRDDYEAWDQAAKNLLSELAAGWEVSQEFVVYAITEDDVELFVGAYDTFDEASRAAKATAIVAGLVTKMERNHVA